MESEQVSSEELYRQMANDLVEYLMGDMSCRYARFFRQTPQELYNALTTDTLYMESFSGNTAAEAGCYIYLGDIEIQFLRLHCNCRESSKGALWMFPEVYGGSCLNTGHQEPNHTVQLLWKLQSWPDSFWSRANILIEPTEHFTRIQVQFLGIPTSVDDAEEIWDENVWRPIIDAFAYRDHLMRWAESLE